MTEKLEWKTYGQGIILARELLDYKCYGKRKVKGKEIYVNYHRILKNGKGISFAERIEEAIRKLPYKWYDHLKDGEA